MKKLIITLFAVVAMIATPAFADKLVVENIVPSPTYVDGSAMDPANISGYEITYSCAGTTATVLSGVSNHTFDNVPAGTCDASVAVMDANGVSGELATQTGIDTTVPTHGAPTFDIRVVSDSTKADRINECLVLPTCTLTATYNLD